MSETARQSNEQRYYDALARIAKGYQSTSHLRRDSREWGLDYGDALEMAYENIQGEAEAAIRGKRRPKS